MTPSEESERVRKGSGWFRMARGLVEVRGDDARTWLNGMISNDVVGLEAESEKNGCYATLLDVKGRILADLHVLARPDSFWLETEADAAPQVLERLDKYIVADDVALALRSDVFARFAIEGPTAGEHLADCLDRAPQLEREAWADFHCAGSEVVIARYGWSGEDGFQLFVPKDGAAAVERALLAAGAFAASDAALEILRIEAGIPRLGAELDAEVFPAEARLERAVATDKGCYVGQEIVERLRSRGHVNHILVGFRFDAEPAELGSRVVVDGKAVGEITSAAVSRSRGAIALGYIRLPHDAPGTRVEIDGRSARVSCLPFDPVSRATS